MAGRKAKDAQEKRVTIKTKDGNFCGIGAAGVQFAHGEATIADGWVANWYRERGYTVVDAAAPVADSTPAEEAD